MQNIKETLLQIMSAALKASKPDGNFKHIPSKPEGKTIILGAGKASASMASAFEKIYPHKIEGLVVTRYGHNNKTKYIKVLEASHPVPDINGLIATKEIINIAKKAEKKDLVIFLISGGASALLFSPVKGVSFQEKQYLNNMLLKSGARINEINIVRQSISAIKGGRLSNIIKPSNLVTYAISDIPGDDPKFIGSGPTVNSNVNVEDAIRILKKYKIDISSVLLKIIKNNNVPKTDETPFYFVSTPMIALEAAQKEALKIGIIPFILTDKLEGEASEEGKKMADLAIKIKQEGEYKNISLDKPILLLSGGETTVTIKGNGSGGRNSEFMLSMAKRLYGLDGIYGLSIDTDGIDGNMDNAGSFISPQTLLKANEKKLNLDKFLKLNDSYTFFKNIDDLIITKPTLTNVNDFRAILILPNRSYSSGKVS